MAGKGKKETLLAHQTTKLKFGRIREELLLFCRFSELDGSIYNVTLCGNRKDGTIEFFG